MNTEDCNNFHTRSDVIVHSLEVYHLFYVYSYECGSYLNQLCCLPPSFTWYTSAVSKWCSVGNEYIYTLFKCCGVVVDNCRSILDFVQEVIWIQHLLRRCTSHCDALQLYTIGSFTQQLDAYNRLTHLRLCKTSMESTKTLKVVTHIAWWLNIQLETTKWTTAIITTMIKRNKLVCMVCRVTRTTFDRLGSLNPKPWNLLIYENI